MYTSVGDIKGIICTAIVTITVVPLMINMLSFSINGAVNHTANLTAATDLIAEATTPWWLGIFQVLTSIPVIGGIIGVGFLFFLRWTGTLDI